MDGKDLGLLLGSFIIILVGVVLVNSIGDSLYLASTISTVTVNESITMATGTGEVANNDVTLITFYGNGSDSTGTGAFVVAESVNVTKATGVVVVNDTSTGAYNITYEYEGTEYVTDSQSRTLINLIPIFFVIAIVLVGYVIVVRSYEKLF